MRQLLDFQLKKVVDADMNEKMYVAYSDSEKKQMLVQVVKRTDKINLREMETKVGQLLKNRSKGILKPVKVVESGDSIVFVYDFFSCQTLAGFIQSNPISTKRFLALGLQLAELLTELHGQKMLLGCMTPNKLFVDSVNDTVFMDAWSYITAANNGSAEMTAYSEADLIYCSPESTGRMGKTNDERSDLYSLGVILFQMLTKETPFRSADLLGTIHSHFTKVPAFPLSGRSHIPKSVADIVLKLMRKTPDDRYQTASGLKKDLQKCSDQWRRRRKIVPFPLGIADRPAPMNHHPFFGREKEIKQLETAFLQAKDGQLQLVLIEGLSGIGKTAVVNRFKAGLSSRNVLFLSGKFDQNQRNVPYSPFIQMFNTFVRRVISEGEAVEQYWRAALKKGLGKYGSLLAELIPEMSWIIEPEPTAVEVEAYEQQNRVLIAFQHLLDTMSKEVTLVIFIDDMQWADKASLDIIVNWMDSNHLKNTFIILASRPDTEKEVSISKAESHPLQILKQYRQHIPLRLQPLSSLEVESWLAETYRFKQDTGSLSAYIYNITQGNPFFITQLMKRLELERLIELDMETNEYNYFLNKQIHLPDHLDVLTILHQKLEMLPRQVIEILSIAACLGNTFQTQELAVIFELPEEDLTDHMATAVSEGIVFADSDSRRGRQRFTFVHDKVQQAIYNRLEKNERGKYHYRIGKQLLDHEREPSRYLFTIIDHLNLSSHLLPEAEWTELAALNSKGGSKAKNAGAFEAAYRYFRMAKQLLSENCWSEDYELAFTIFKGLGECAYLNSRFSEAEQMFALLLDKAKTVGEKLTIYNLKLIQYTHLNRAEEAVTTGLDGLNLAGWNLSHQISKWKIVKELVSIHCLLINKKSAGLLDLPEMKNEQKKQIMQTLINMNAPTYHVNQNLATYFMLRAFRFTLRNGDTDISALVYNNYALILSAGFGNYNKSDEFGKLAIEHVNRSGVTKLKPRVYFVYGSFVNHWKYPIKHNLYYLQKSQKLSLEVGNVHLAGAASSFITITQLMKGDPVDSVLNSINEQLALVRRIQYPVSIGFLQEMECWLKLLTFTANEPVAFSVKEFANDPSAFIMHNTLRLQMLFLLNDRTRMEEVIMALNEVVSKTLVLVIAPEFYYYQSLGLCRLYLAKSSAEKKKFKRLLIRNVKKMKKWAESSPANYMHKYLLMKAETNQVLNKKVPGKWYSRAVDLAVENGFFQDAAVICELAGQYHLRNGAVKHGEMLIGEAHKLFEQWGAKKLVSMLEEKYPQFFTTKETLTLKSLNKMIDLESLFQASRVISSEIRLDRLIAEMLKIVIEYAGAEKGYLFLQEEGELYLASPASGEQPGIQRFPLHEAKHQAAVQVVRFAARSKEHIVLDHAHHDGLFQNDFYINKHETKSVLCLPILLQRELIGVLYLENSLVTHAFTDDKIYLISLLAYQAAVSIQNAQVFSLLEEKVKRRTGELETANRQLEKANAELARAAQLRKELLSNISHDLLTPIASVQGFIEGMLEGVFDTSEMQTVYLKRSKERLRALTRLIEDLFDLTQLESGSLRFAKEAVAVDQLFTYLCNQTELDIKCRGLQFHRQIVAAEPTGDSDYPLVEADIGRIDQVFTNIVSNSLKYTEKGAISARLHVAATRDVVTFEISDTGIGMTEEELAKIFERTYTNRKNAHFSGHGLGLAISKEIIYQHQGDIWAESNPGKGTSIFFTLPVRK
ncbi:Predicted ATPase [Evansella caseinilytica]|uniref:histidine kinase n=1 Tax=Evansella caseinilytica TaxID=1503961 RepID=A0A1H3UT92_9BACI|nr:AAA family ATPase [Evansella caseinilytica]SDZ65597.1 Predicted ATPase [Evansella caseinilytica]